MAKLLIISGEPSGDLFASGLIESLKKRRGETAFYAMGGENSASAGAELIADIGELSVMRFAAVLFNLNSIGKVFKKVKD